MTTARAGQVLTKTFMELVETSWLLTPGFLAPLVGEI
jgi:hypothetical protein